MADSIQLNGPSLKPLSGTVKQLVIFLHGYGADGNDLLSIGQLWQKSFPNAEFISPNAPFPCDMSPFGRQWFTIGDISEEYLLNGIQVAAPILNHFIDQALEDRGLHDSQLALVGFSQGTMMALHVATHRPNPCAGVIGYSGVFVCPDHSLIKAYPSTLLVHGDQDTVIPVDCLDQSRLKLEECGVPVKAYRRDKLGHGIDEVGLSLGEDFLRNHLPL